MSNRRAILLLVVLLGVLLLAAYFGRSDRQRISSVSSSYSAFPRGLKGLYLYWKESGMNVTRRRENLVVLPKGTDQLLILSEPSAVSVTKEEAVSLLNWIDRGNHLILASRCGESLIRASLDREVLSTLQIGCRRTGDWKQDFVSERVELKPTFSVPLNRKVRAISCKELVLEQVSLPESAAVLEHENRPAAGFLQRGKGFVLFLAGSSIMENSEINQKDNLQLISNFLLLAQPQRIYFDEYHHGYREVFSSLSQERLRVLSLTSLQLLLLLGIFLLAGGRRLGPPRQRLSQRGRSALETVQSLAFLFLKAAKYNYLATSLQQDLKAALHRKYNLSKDLSNFSELTGAIQLHESESKDLRSILEFRFPRVLSEKSFLHFARNVDVWRAKLRI